MKNFSRMISIGCLLWTAALAGAQGWSDAYSRGLEAVRAERWADARNAFRQASGLRAEDVSAPTTLKGGSAADPKLWRDGAAYSPNFGAAYSAYKMALKTADEGERDELLTTALREFETLVKKNQASREASYFIGMIFDLRRDTSGRAAWDAKSGAMKLDWRVDAELISLEERAAIFGNVAVQPARPNEKPVAAPKEPATTTPRKSKPAKEEKQPKTVRQPKVNPTAEPKEEPKTAPEVEKQAKPKPEVKPEQKEPKPVKKPVKNPTQEDAPPAISQPAKTNSGDGTITPTDLNPTVDDKTPVPAVDNKFALLVGNDQSAMVGQNVSFAANDIDFLKDKLTFHAGYKPENVVALKNVTAGQILEAAAKLAERVPENGTVMVYFTGNGANLEGHDYLAGIDTAMPTDTSTMIEKTKVYQQFMSRGAKIYAFFQVSRPILGGKCFGQEQLALGAISQMQATIPGGTIASTFSNGKDVGLFTNAVVNVLQELRSNRIPILEFGWQVFEKIRGGSRTNAGGGATQVPTLPQLTNLAPDSRF